MADPVATSSAHPANLPVEQRFELLGRIGAGNHGVVFRARDHQLHRDVAIKRFSHFLADDERAMRRITREVNTLARVSHPHVVTVHDLVRMADGDGEITPHLVMELVEGSSLRDLLVSHGPSLRSVIVVRSVLEGLAACHHAGILHLDIKPANVLVTPDGGVKIVDFGIARAASDATATIAGTPHYMPPEQYEGRADERSDIYSVGCLLFECLTGSPPFQGTLASQLLAHRDDPRPDPRAVAPLVSPALAAVVMRAMAIEPDDRYASVHDMLAVMAAADGGSVERYVAPSMSTQPVPPVTAPAAPPVAAPVVKRLPRDPGEPEAAPPVAAGPGTAGVVVTRWARLRTFAIGFVISVFVVAVVPGLVWVSASLAPSDYRPDAMSTNYTGTWWILAVTIATAFLLLRRQTYFAMIGGPPVGSPLPDRTIDAHVRSGVRMAAGAAVRGSLPMLFPWYVVLVAAISEAGGLSWPDDVFSAWGIAWLLMPLAATLLALRALTKLRPRPGAVMKSTFYLGGAALAVLLFVAYPVALSWGGVILRP